MIRRSAFGILALIAFFLSSPALTATPMNEHVILLHGLCRTSASMAKMESALTQAGYRVWNVDYPSRTNTVAGLSDSVLPAVIRDCQKTGAERIHFVGHSLGAILIRDYLARHELPEVGRVVMLGPPNCGSEVVDKLGSWWLFRKINGPAGNELGTSPDSAPNRIAQLHSNIAVGIIAGNRSINWINSLQIPGPDDGKVSVERTRLKDATGHLVLRTTHPFLMKNAMAIQQTIRFLRVGQFERPGRDTH
jgi:triacylglycerol lipase